MNVQSVLARLANIENEAAALRRELADEPPAPRQTMQGLLDAAGYASQKDLARATGLIESSISDYVRTGARNLKAETLTTLAKALRVPPVDVLAALHETRRQSLQLHRPGVPA